jgi:hypothetical protein
MSEYAIQILDDNDEDVGDVIPLSEYLGGNKTGAQLLDRINEEIDSVENDNDDDAD